MTANGNACVCVVRLAAAIALGLCLSGIARAQGTLEVIPLRYRAAAEVIPVIQPMLAPGGSVSGFQGQLVVRTTPENLEEIKRILASIDAAPRQLIITVRQDADAHSTSSAAEVSGSAGGSRGRVTLPGNRDSRGGSVVLQEGDDRLRARVLDTDTSASDRNIHSVRVLEGREAYVQVGQSVPVRDRQVRRTVVGGQVVEQVIGGTQYRDVTSGFYVVPRIAGDRVTLDIRPQREALSGQVRGGINVQSVTTTVSARLGEWVEIGGIAQDASGQESVLLGRSGMASRDSRRVLVKVEEVR
jgi:type II secretory pathway component GspD/PulD (secretin)